MKLGVMDYIVAANDEHTMFGRARALGFAGVELNLARGDLFDPAQSRLRRLIAARDASGLAVPSLVLGEHNNGGIGSDDEATADAARDDIRAAIVWAAALGAPVILTPFFFRGDLVSEAQFERAARAFAELCPLAAAHGVSLCYEGTLPAAAIRRMADLVASPAFGCYFDLANVVWRGMDTATEIRRLGPLIRQVHMKETRIGAGDVAPGLGRVDYAAAAAALAEIGYDDWMVMETPAGPDALLLRDISFTRRYFPGIAATAPWPRFGAFTYEFDHGEAERAAAAFQAAGLTAAQLGGPLLEDALQSTAAAARTREIFEAHGVRITALAGYRNLITPDLEQRRAGIAFLQRCLASAPLLGAGVVATETGTCCATSEWADDPANWDAPAWEDLCAVLAELLPVAEQHGTILALEGYVNNILKHHGQILGLFERFPTPYLQLVCDPYNYLSSHLLPVAAASTAAFFDRFEHRLVLAHLKDVGPDGAEVDTPEFGTGVFPQALYLEFLRDRRPDLPLILEHLPWEHIPAAIERVRAVSDAS